MINSFNQFQKAETQQITNQRKCCLKKAKTNATLTTRYTEHSLMIAPLVTDTAKLSIDSPTANNNISQNDIADKLDIKMLKKQKLCPIFSDTTFCIESDYISSAIL